MSLYKYRLYQLITTSELPKNQHASISAKTVKKTYCYSHQIKTLHISSICEAMLNSGAIE